MKKIILFALALNFVSCGDDDHAATEPTPLNNNPVFDYYTVENTNTDEASGTTAGSLMTANLQDQKLFSETVEYFLDGVSQSEVTEQHYFYENEHLVKRVYGGDVRQFFYDAQDRLIAIDWEFGQGESSSHIHYRINYVDANNVYFDRYYAPYSEPNPTLAGRIILTFDANNNIIQAGTDQGLDGTVNLPHTFDYDANNNLTAIHKNDGTTIPIAYSDIRDNFFKLFLNTMGSKKNLMVYNAECYAYLLPETRLSPNLRQTDIQEANYEFTLAQAPYYFKKTKTVALDENRENTTVTTFYFE